MINLQIVLIFLLTLSVIHCQQTNNNEELAPNKTVTGSRRRQGNKQRNKNNNNHWGTTSTSRRRNNNNDPLISPSSDDENPLFPPRSDSFWKTDHHRTTSSGSSSSSSSNNKRHGKKRQHNDENHRQKLEPKIPKVTPTPSTTEDPTDRPNIILIITDDQDVELGSMNYMPETLKEFQDNGIEFRHGYVTTPMCCPSRSSMLTGLYVHNHQVFTNNDNCSSIQWRQRYEKKTFAYQLHEAGYYTSYIGKYLNKYDGSHIPAGWDEWNTLLMNSRFYNYTINRNGKKYRYGNNYEFDYYPDLITNDTLDFLDRAGGLGSSPLTSESMSSTTTATPLTTGTSEAFTAESSGTTTESDDEGGGGGGYSQERKRIPQKPFLLVLSYPSPHGPEDSAPQYSDLFMNSTSHHTPSYNFAPNLDKQWILRVTEKMTPQLESFTNLLMAKRLQTLQSVDVAMKQIFDKLRETRLIENTYIFYTSDHGYHVGQFGLIKGKSMPYEFDIRVPFYVRVPTQLEEASSLNHPSRGIRITEPVLNIDLAPTFLEIGRVPVPSWVDGRSMIPLINHYVNRPVNYTGPGPMDQSWGHTFIIESSGRREPIPSSTESLKKKRKVQREELLLEEEETLSNLCLMHPYPCLPRQKKYCRMDRSRIRFRKCRPSFDYQIVSNVSKCSCTSSGQQRRRRSAPKEEGNLDWDEERVRIDEEIEELKSKIDALRERRRKLRVEWLSGIQGKFNSSPNNNNNKEWRGDRKGQGQEDLLVEEELLEEDLPLVFHHSEEEDDSLDDVTDGAEGGVGVGGGGGGHALIEFPQVNPSRRGKGHRGRFGGDRKGKKRKGGRPFRGPVLIGPEDEECDCTPALSPSVMKQIERDERKRRKLMSKIRKKQRFLNRIDDPNVRQQAETCGTEEKMNCFWHDADHWRTPPLWSDGSFCFCMNSNNNTFTCLRSINSTHNYLYCHFITGFKMFFNLQEDPHELRNLIGSLPASSEDWMLSQLFHLKKCQGTQDCWPNSLDSVSTVLETTESTVWQQILGRSWKGKRKNRNGRRQKQY